MKIFLSVFYCFLSLSTLANIKANGESQPAALWYSLEDTIPNYKVVAKDGVTDCNCDSLWVFEEMIEIFSLEDHELLIPAYNADSLNLAHAQLYPTAYYTEMKFFLVMIFFKEYNSPRYIINKKLSARNWDAFKSYKEVRDEKLQWANYHKKSYQNNNTRRVIPMCDYFLDCIIDNPYDEIAFDSISNTEEFIQLKKEQDAWLQSPEGLDVKRKWEYYNLHGEHEEQAEKRQAKIDQKKKREQERLDEVEWHKKKEKRDKIGYFILAGVLLVLAVLLWAIVLPGAFAVSMATGIGLFFILILGSALLATAASIAILLMGFGLI